MVGGQSDILESLTIAGPNNAFLYDHTLNNYGRMTLDKRPSSGGLLLRNQGSDPVGIWNRPEATFHHLGGALAEGSTLGPCVFVNEGRYLKSGPDVAWVRLGRFQNLGVVDVSEGILEFQGENGTFGGEEHLGSYHVAAGAQLNLLSRFSVFGRSTRLEGDGSLDLVGGGTEIHFPGRIAIHGGVRLRTGRIGFSGDIDSRGAWALAGSARFSGLAPRVSGKMVIERSGTLIVETGSELTLNSLLSSNQVVVNTGLNVAGPAEFQGGVLAGAGRLSLGGPVSFSGTVGSVGSGGSGVIEIGGVSVCAADAVVRPINFQLRILPAGAWDFGAAAEVRFANVPILNEGILEKSQPGGTRVVNGLENRGTFRVREGGIAWEGRTLLQWQGLISLNTTGLVVRSAANSAANGVVDLRGGRLEGGQQIYCGLFTNAAVVAPGLPIGRLDLQVGTHPSLSVYHQTSAGRLEIDVTGAEPGVGYDQIHVTGRAVLGGTLQIVAAPSYDPPLGTELTILTARGIEGAFDEVVGDALQGGKRWETEYTPTQVILRAVRTP